MTLAKLIAYAFIATVLVSIAIAVDRDEPISHAFRPIKSFRAFCWQLAVAGIICGLLAWQFLSESQLFGQQPRMWAMLLAQVYAWVCLAAYLKRRA